MSTKTAATDVQERRPWRRRMVGRDPDERHRASTPLELLFDLCFVVAVAQAGAQLHYALTAARLWPALLSYVTIFFAIWWAWMNFTWFASAYDTDDVPYRVLSLVQIAGALVLAVAYRRRSGATTSQRSRSAT